MLQLGQRYVARAGIVEVQVVLLEGFLTRGALPTAMHDSKGWGRWWVRKSPCLVIRAVLGLLLLAPQDGAGLFALGSAASNELVQERDLQDHAAMSSGSCQFFALLKNAPYVCASFLVGVKSRNIPYDFGRETAENEQPRTNLSLCRAGQ
jgi:hypothetical protein